MNKVALIIGNKGMLGQELMKSLEKNTNYKIVAWDRDEIDVRDIEKMRKVIIELNPDVIYNAVAYNAVDACEENEEEYNKLQKLNVEVPIELAKISKEIDATFVQYSSDYVFGGDNTKKVDYKGGYTEDEKTNPISKYGKSRVEAEEAIEDILKDKKYYIIRLSKLFGNPASSLAGKKSFFDFMLEKGKEAREKGEKVMAVDGEVSRFTYAKDLADESVSIVEDNCKNGVYHITNEGTCSWYEGLIELYKIMGLSDVEIEPVSPATFPRPAKRPSFSALKNTKRPLLRHYTEALKDYYKNLSKIS